jgi:hypothetical protein
MDLFDEETTEAEVNPLDEMQREHSMMNLSSLGSLKTSERLRLVFDWALVCDIDEDNLEAIQGTDYRQQHFPHDQPPSHPLVAELKIKLHDLSLTVHGFRARMGGRYYIQIGATEDVLMHWAQEMRLPMRLTSSVSTLQDELHDVRRKLQKYATAHERASEESGSPRAGDLRGAITLWVANIQDELFQVALDVTNAEDARDEGHQELFRRRSLEERVRDSGLAEIAAIFNLLT